jgi:dynactin complex subunit
MRRSQQGVKERNTVNSLEMAKQEELQDIRKVVKRQEAEAKKIRLQRQPGV